MIHPDTHQPLAEINVVPYIDVMLVLLIIFMVATPLLTAGVNVNLPKADAKTISATTQQPIIVSITQKGDYFLNIADHPDAPVNTSTLLHRVAAALAIAQPSHKQTPVFVKADQHVNYGDVMRVMALLQQAGAPSVGLLTAHTQKH